MATKKVITRGGGEKMFVKMGASESWLVGAATGQKVHGMLCRTTLLTTLHEFVEKACNGELDTKAAAEEDGDEYDPMQEFEVDDGTHSLSRGGGDPSKRTRYQHNKAKNRLVTVTVPAVSPEEDPKSTSTRIIQLYVVDRKQLWLDLDDVEWAVRFLYMQFSLKGVPVVSPDDAGPEAPEAQAPPEAFLTPEKRKANDPW